MSGEPSSYLWRRVGGVEQLAADVVGVLVFSNHLRLALRGDIATACPPGPATQVR